MSQLITNEYPGLPTVSFGVLANQFNLDSADQLAEFLWRVRVWQIVVNVTSPAGPNSNNGTNLMGQWALGTPYAATTAWFSNERDLVLANDPSWFPSSYPAYPGYPPQQFLFGISDPIGHFEAQFAFEYGFDVASGVQSNWFLSPLVDINDGPGFTSLTTGIDVPHGIVDVSAVAFTLAGKPCNLYENTGLFAYTGNITITPYEWWPYEPTSGGLPVFDSATGLQINPNIVVD
jgi:hypothetical protein